MFQVSRLARRGLPIAAFVALLVVVFLLYFYFSSQTSPAPYPETVELSSARSFEEHKEYFVKIAQKKGAVYAFKVLQYANMPSAINRHRIGHYIGYIHFEQEGLSGIHSCPTDFLYACAHAIVVQALITLGTQALHDVAKVCSEAPGGADAYVHCFHGVGHGLMAYFNYDYKSAINTCKKVYDIAVVRRPEVTTTLLWQECIGGATMELTQGGHDEDAWEKGKLVYMPENDILMPCNADFMPSEMRSACYSYLKPRFLEAAGATRDAVNPDAYSKALSYCKKIPDDDFGSRYGCYAGFGAAFAYIANGDAHTLGYMSESAIHNVHEWCSFIDDAKGRRECSLSALDNIFWNGKSGSPASTVYCSLAPESEIRRSCFTKLISYARDSFSSQKQLDVFCETLPSEYADTCASGTPYPHAP